MQLARNFFHSVDCLFTLPVDSLLPNAMQFNLLILGAASVLLSPAQRVLPCLSREGFSSCLPLALQGFRFQIKVCNPLELTFFCLLYLCMDGVQACRYACPHECGQMYVCVSGSCRLMSGISLHHIYSLFIKMGIYYEARQRLLR